MYHAAMQVQFADGPPVEGMTMSPGALHGPCDPQLDGTIHTLLSLRARQGVAIQSEALHGMPDAVHWIAASLRSSQ
jgi:hypothetical protein